MHSYIHWLKGLPRVRTDWAAPSHWPWFGRDLALQKSEAVTRTKIWWFPKIGVPQNGWFIMENPIKMDDLGVPLFSETSISWLNVCTVLKQHKFEYESHLCNFFTIIEMKAGLQTASQVQNFQDHSSMLVSVPKSPSWGDHFYQVSYLDILYTYKLYLIYTIYLIFDTSYINITIWTCTSKKLWLQ